MVLVNTDYISGKELGMLGMVNESLHRNDERSKRSGNSPDD